MTNRRHFGNVRRPALRAIPGELLPARRAASHPPRLTFVAKADALAYLATVETDLGVVPGSARRQATSPSRN